MATVFIGVPTYDGRLDADTASGVYMRATQEHRIIASVHGKSLLSSNCNELLCQAINAQVPVDWFCMLHADIAPEPQWLDKMIAEAERHNADMLAACVPIKDDRGLTSTALGPWSVGTAYGRLSMRQLLSDDFPETFDAESIYRQFMQCDQRPALWNNTGCMVLRMSKWVPSIRFYNQDGITQRSDGTWFHWGFSEDWAFSLECEKAGLHVMATTAVKVRHKGSVSFPNTEAWGSVTTEFQPLEVAGV